MFKLVLSQLKQRNNIILFSVLFILFMSLYVFMDNFGYQTYQMLGDAFGYRVVYQTMTLNIVISLISSFTITISIINYRMNNTKTSGGIFTSIGNLIAITFSGCSSCGISVLSAIGISVGLPTIMPGAVRFKFLSLILIIIGLLVSIYLIETNTCKINKESHHEG